MDFGRRVADGMKVRGFKTQKAFAEKAEITPQYVTNILRYGAIPDLEVLQRIARAFEMDTGDLLTDSDEAFYMALQEPDPTAPDVFLDSLIEVEPRSGLVRDHEVRNVVGADGSVRGPVAFIGATGPAAGLAKALDLGIGQRSGKAKMKVVPLAGIPEGAELIELQERVVVWIDGELALVHPAGRILVVEIGAEPKPLPIELVVVAQDPDPHMAPNPDRPEPMHGDARLMRYEPGPRGVQLFFPLDSDDAVTPGAGWRLVGVVVDDRPPPRDI